MKKLILILAIICLMPVGAWATTYYACIAGNISAANAWEDAVGCDGTTFTIGTGGFPASGSVLEANNQAMVIDTDPGPNGKVTLQNTANGGFTFTVNDHDAITINADLTSVGAADLLVVSGAGAGTATTELTIVGNIKGAAEEGLLASLTLGKIVVTGNATGGSASNKYGISVTGATAGLTLSGTATGGTAAGTHGLYVASSGAAVVTANNCTGSNTGNAASGCYFVTTATATCTVTGNILGQDGSTGAAGRFKWEPANAEKYFAIDGGGTPIYVGKVTCSSDTCQAAEVPTDMTYILQTDGTYTTGTKAATSGGGAWGF